METTRGERDCLPDFQKWEKEVGWKAGSATGFKRPWQKGVIVLGFLFGKIEKGVFVFGFFVCSFHIGVGERVKCCGKIDKGVSVFGFFVCSFHLGVGERVQWYGKTEKGVFVFGIV